MKKTQKVLFVPDSHHPYHDERAWKIMLRAAKKLRPDIIVVMGDLADFYQVSQHDKRPGRMPFEDEVVSVREALDSLDALGARKKIYCMGNHEDRLERYLATTAPEVYRFLSVDKLLGLSGRGYKVVDFLDHIKLGKLYLSHCEDKKKCGKDAHRQARIRFGGNLAMGHTHYLSVDYEGSADGLPHVGAVFGWLGSVKDIDYTSRAQARKWVHGFGVGYLMKNGDIHLQAVPIVNGRCVVEGRVIV